VRSDSHWASLHTRVPQPVVAVRKAT
jgi:hypothetical protein